MIEAAKLEADIYPAGPRGLSAYEIYKKEGGQLSEEEWLKSLNGLTPTIGENGNWFLGTVDTGLPSRGPKGDTGSIKFIVVTELPTENIDETAIYLKPVESPTGENKFEELIYVNGKWEDLGTPNVAVDLSNYYTKEETDEKLDGKQEVLPVYHAFRNDTPANLLPIFNAWLADYNRTGVMATFYMRYNPNEPTGKSFLKCVTTDGDNRNWFFDFSHTQGGIDAQLNQWVYQLTYDKTNNVFTNCTKLPHNSDALTPIYNFSKYAYFGKLALSTTNTHEYTPTGDYNPATKKYVDDNVKTYTAGDNITISEDNVISALAGSNYPIYQMIARWDNLDISGSSSSTITTDETIVNILNNFLTNVANQDNQIGTLTLMNVPRNFGSFSINYIGISNIIQFNQTLTSFTICLNIYCFGAEGRYQYRRIGAFHKLSGNGKWENNSFSITSLSLYKDSGDSTGNMSFTSATEEKVNREYLKKTNTSSYTPTGDYNPSTKLYTDKTHYEKMTGYDATKTQVLKNINGTLTWVDEV